MSRLLALATLLAATGCDSTGDVQPVDGVVLVSIGEAPNDGPGLRLQTEAAYPCGSRLLVTEETRDGRLRVAVDGVSGPGACDAADGPLFYSTFLPDARPMARIEVRHRSETDVYNYICGFAGCGLVAVRTSTTRLTEAPAP